MMDLSTTSAFFKALSDPVRLRLLHLLQVEELSVGELVRILDLPQSTVSRHLKFLRENGLVADQPLGAATYYRATLEADLGTEEAALRDSLGKLLGPDALPPVDRERLNAVLALREANGEAFFDRMGARWDALREHCFGPTFHLEALLRLLPSDWVVADLGTGTGYLLPLLGSHFRRVIAIDMSRQMLDLAARRIAEAGLGNVELRPGRLESPPLERDEVNLALAFLLLHHLEQAPQALSRIAQALKADGRLLIVEIHPHQNERFRTRMADRRPGIEAGQLASWLDQAGLRVTQRWDVPYVERPEHELAPLPRLYGILAQKPS